MKVSPSILTCDFARLGEAVIAADAWGADWLHLDVMDGVFVPNLSFGPAVIRSLRPLFSRPFDVHLMMEHPERLLPAFLTAGADRVTLHVECSAPIADTLAAIRAGGAAAGLSLCPGTPVEALTPYLSLVDSVLVMTVEPGFGGQVLREDCVEKIRALAAERARLGLSFDIAVDGGVNSCNLSLLAAAGADTVVIGSALYAAADPAELVKAAREL